MAALFHDLRYAFRMLLKGPGFTAVAVLTLALGIGANTAIFSVVNAALLRPLPYAQPERLITLGETRQQSTYPFPNTSHPDFLDWKQESKSFDSIAGYGYDNVTLLGNGSPENIDVSRVTSNFFATLGTPPVLGRDFLPGEDEKDGAKVVILTNAFWKGHFGGNPGVLGQTMRLNGIGHTIVGVLPANFEFAPAGNPQIWLPLSMNEDLDTRRSLRWMRIIGRLRPGVSFAQATSEMQAINAGLAKAHPKENGAIAVVLGNLREQIVGKVRPLLAILLGAVSFVLLIACANVAHLMLARSTTRSKEIAIRMALGAGRWQVARQLLTESVLLASLGGIIGLAGAQWSVPLLLSAIPEKQRATMPFLNSLHLDLAVLLFLFGVTLATGIAFGLFPALQMSRRDFGESLKDDSRGSAGSRGSWLRDALVVAELSISIVLLVGAGLMVRSMISLLHENPGFDSRNMLTFAVNLPQTSYKEEPAMLSFQQRLNTALEALPGVQGVGEVSRLPVTGNGGSIRFAIEGRPKALGDEDEAFIRDVNISYFRVLRMPALKGRLYGVDDTMTAPPRAVVNQAFAEHYFPNEEAVGKRIRFTYSVKEPFREIIGVVSNENSEALDAPMPPIIYASTEQSPDSAFYVVVRTPGEPQNMVSAVRGTLQQLDPQLPLIEPRSMEDVIFSSYAVFLRRYPSYLIGSFAAIALILAMVGLFGQISYSVAQRTREIGIRMALGADPRDVLRLVLGQGMLLTVSGLFAGLLATLALTRLLSDLLFGVTPTDPWTFAAVACLLSGVAMLATYIPARRATRVDPLVALRYE